MNIKINKEQFDYIMINTQHYSYVIGSHLYDTNNEKSDKDVMIIYESFHQSADMYYPNTHQFQYDDIENNTQYIFTTIERFYRNMFSGDASINVDILMFYYMDMKLSIEETLNIVRTYNIIRAFIGFAKRDIKMFRSSKGKNKLFHIERGLYCANELMENRLPNLEDIRKIFDNPKSLDILRDYGTELHAKCTKLFESDDLTMYPKVSIIKPSSDLERILIESNNIKNFTY